MSDHLTKHFFDTATDTATVWTASEHSDDSFLLLAKRIVAHDKKWLKNVNGHMFKRLNLLIAIAKGKTTKIYIQPIFQGISHWSFLYYYSKLPVNPTYQRAGIRICYVLRRHN